MDGEPPKAAVDDGAVDVGDDVDDAAHSPTGAGLKRSSISEDNDADSATTSRTASPAPSAKRRRSGSGSTMDLYCYSPIGNDASDATDASDAADTTDATVSPVAGTGDGGWWLGQRHGCDAVDEEDDGAAWRAVHLEALMWRHLSASLPEQLEQVLLSRTQYRLLRAREQAHLARPDYMAQQQAQTLSVPMRTKLFEWLLQVVRHAGFHESIFALAANYVDRFLSAVPNFSYRMLQLLGATCLRLAVRLCAMEPVARTPDLPARYLCHLSCNTFTVDCLVEMERQLLTALDWRAHAVTPYEYLADLAYRLGTDLRLPQPGLLQLCALADALVVEAIMAYELLPFPPSVCAAAAVAAACRRHDAVAAPDVVVAAKLADILDLPSAEPILRCAEALAPAASARQ